MANPSLSSRLEAALLDLNREEVRRVIIEGVGPTALSVADFADKVVAPALTRIGSGWEQGRVALSQVFMAGRIMEASLDENHLPLTRTSTARIGIGVLGDHHNLGKTLVSNVLRIGGYDVVDLGSGLTPGEMVDRAVEADIAVLMISVLMLNRAFQVREVGGLLAERQAVRLPVVVGGAPFVHDRRLWRRVGADACGRNAAEALAIVPRLTGAG